MKYLIIILFFLFPIYLTAQVVELDRCIDGDTAVFIVDGESKSTRFLAIDTPEYTTKKEIWGKEASDFTCNKLKKAKVIFLEYDSNSDLYDRYNRLLAWIFVDDVLLQELIVENGLGKVAYLYGNYKYTEILEAKELIAKEEGLGIWSNRKENEIVTISLLTLIVMSIINLIYFYFKKSNKSYLSRIYKCQNIYLKLFLIFLYIITVILVINDFTIVIKELTRYQKKLKKAF